MDQSFYDQIDRWHREGRHQDIIDAINALPPKDRDDELTGLLARALLNLDRYEEGLEQLLTVPEEGRQDPMWHFRVGYAHYYLGETEEAMSAFEEACERDPEFEDAWMFLSWCCDQLGVDSRLELPPEDYFDEGPDDGQSGYDPELYTEEEMTAVEEHIDRYFGRCDSVFHELVSPDIHVDICIIEPTAERNYYTMVTMGMGAHWMNVPEELTGQELERAEVLICLPPDWPIQSNEDRWYWPLRWLKILARLPGEEDGWLGFGHTVTNGGPFADNTGLSGVILLGAQDAPKGAGRCPMPDGGSLVFYQVIPLYPEEMDYKINYGTDALLDRMRHVDHVLDISRPNTCAGF